MESAKSTSEAERPELSESDIQWLQDTIGIEIWRDYKWHSMDYLRAFECYFAKMDKCQLNARNADGNTPLHLAAISENYSAIEGLLLCGADVNALNNLKQTPATYSQQYPDYSAGFQFFRHLHKLAFLGQHICKENLEWYDKVHQTYNQIYQRDGYIAAFAHNRSFNEDTIRNVRDGGENVIFQMYEKELQRIKHSTIKKCKLERILKLTDGNDIAENHLNDIKKYMRNANFQKNYPIFGFMFKQKYWQTLEHLNSRKLEHGDSSSSPRNLRNTSSKADVGNAKQINGIDYAKSLKSETERHMQEFMARQDTVVVKLMKESERREETNQRKVTDIRDSCNNNVTRKVVKFENFNDERNTSPAGPINSDDKLDKLRKMVARLRTQ